MKTSLLTALAVLCISIASRADEASHLALATQVVDMTTSKDVLRATLLSGLEPLVQRLKNNGLPPSVIDEVRKAVGDFFDKKIDFEAVRSKHAEIYAAEYSEDDLKGILAFYQSPVGKKMIEKTPEVNQKFNEFTQQQLAGTVADLQQAIGSVLQKYMPAPGGKPGFPGLPMGPRSAPGAPAPAPAPAPAGPTNSAK